MPIGVNSGALPGMALGQFAAPREGTPSPHRHGGPGLVSALALAAALLACAASAAADRTLRVGTSGDYAPFSVIVAAPGGPALPRYEGFDPDLARAYARDRNLTVQFVQFRWPELIDDLEAGRFDVAMSGITVRPERSLAGRFTVPVALSGAVALVPAEGPLKRVDDLDRTGIQIAVNAGGHLERTARARFPRATVLPISNNADVLGAMAQGVAQAVVTDTQEAPHWRARRSGLRVLGPFSRDRKALLVAAGQPGLARDLDAWLLAAERSGRMAEWRARSLDEPGQPPRSVLSALLAAISERLALMPLVAESKRSSGSAIEVPEREARVVDAALARVRETERLAEVPPSGAIPEAAVRQLFRAQIEAAKSIQLRVLALPRPPAGPAPPDLDGALRPALLRIGDRIARLVVQLPAGIGADEIRTLSARELGSLNLPKERVDDLAHALLALRPPPHQ
ncbi:MAG: transporter substrate-binding domain-containing protein [Myxococcota bacterium]|nr:transporter substrate-binding domain-containing protein [Myxococcota bacterium]